MWSVAPVSRIQELDLKQCLSMTWAEKIEWDKLGAIPKGLPEKLEEDDEAEAAIGEEVTIITFPYFLCIIMQRKSNLKSSRIYS